jgi:hypothetical protein
VQPSLKLEISLSEQCCMSVPLTPLVITAGLPSAYSRPAVKPWRTQSVVQGFVAFKVRRLAIPLMFMTLNSAFSSCGKLDMVPALIYNMRVTYRCRGDSIRPISDFLVFRAGILHRGCSLGFLHFRGRWLNVRY